MTSLLLKELDDKIFFITFLTFVGTIIAFWFSYAYPQAMNENMGVLLIFAERLLQGGQIGLDIYETNPPLSILIYTPVIWIRDLTGLDIHDSSFLYISFCIFVSAFLVVRLLSRQRDRSYENLLIVSMYILANLFITVNDYGEREHFVLLGLMPLSLLICFKTQDKEIGKCLTIVTAGLGILLILIKPHFGLVPAALFLHRAWKRRHLFAPLKDLDFIVMSVGTLFYVLLLLTLFKDYLALLPDILTLYASKVLYRGFLFILPAIFLVLLLVMIALTSINERIKVKINALYFFGGLTFFSLLSFMAQTKGLMYQLIPASIFFMISFSLYLFYTLTPFLKEKRALFVSVALPLLIALCTLYPLNFNFPDREKIRELPFAQWFKTYCPAEKQCAAYIFHEAVDGVFASFHYTDTVYTSRFASHWFLPSILSTLEQSRRGLPLKGPLSLEQAQSLNSKFGGFVGEDFQRFKPDFVAIIRTKYGVETNNPNTELLDLDFVAHYSQFDLFRKEWKNYQYVGTKTIDRKYYFKGTGLDYDHLMTYDLYVRRPTE